MSRPGTQTDRRPIDFASTGGRARVDPRIDPRSDRPSPPPHSGGYRTAPLRRWTPSAISADPSAGSATRRRSEGERHRPSPPRMRIQLHAAGRPHLRRGLSTARGGPRGRRLLGKPERLLPLRPPQSVTRATTASMCDQTSTDMGGRQQFRDSASSAAASRALISTIRFLQNQTQRAAHHSWVGLGSLGAAVRRRSGPLTSLRRASAPSVVEKVMRVQVEVQCRSSTGRGLSSTFFSTDAGHREVPPQSDGS